MMYAHQTYVPAPMQQSAPILSRDRIDMTANKLELTVPLLHEPHTAKEVLVGAYNTLGQQVPTLSRPFSSDYSSVTSNLTINLSPGPQTVLCHDACSCVSCQAVSQAQLQER